LTAQGTSERAIFNRAVERGNLLVAGATERIRPGHGHLSIAVGSIDRIVAELAASAG